MKRTSVFLDESLLRRAQDHADRQGTSFAQLVREAVAAYLAHGTGTAARAAGTLPAFAGRFASGEGETSERADQRLWQDPHA